MKTTKRSKRLAEFLDVQARWTIYPDRLKCTKCKKEGHGSFCQYCGKKLVRVFDHDPLKTLESAISFALEEK
jgi:hypothetical protein